jgi:hypothetical protein
MGYRSKTGKWLAVLFLTLFAVLGLFAFGGVMGAETHQETAMSGGLPYDSVDAAIIDIDATVVADEGLGACKSLYLYKENAISSTPDTDAIVKDEAGARCPAYVLIATPATEVRHRWEADILLC